MRRLASRKIVEELGIVVLHEFYPSGRTASHHGQCAAVVQSVQKLGAFLKDSKVGGKVHVEYLLEAQTAKARYHFALNIASYGGAELLAESDSDRGRGCRDNIFCGVGKRRQYVVYLLFFPKCARRAYVDALTATHTWHVC